MTLCYININCAQTNAQTDKPTMDIANPNKASTFSTSHGLILRL